MMYFFYSLQEVFSILPCIQFQHSPVVLCFFLSMEGNIPWMFMEIMWEFSICFFASYKVNIPMYAEEFFLCYVFFMQGDLNKSNTRNIFVGCKWKFTFQTKPRWGFATVYQWGQKASQALHYKAVLQQILNKTKAM